MATLDKKQPIASPWLPPSLLAESHPPVTETPVAAPIQAPAAAPASRPVAPAAGPFSYIVDGPRPGSVTCQPGGNQYPYPIGPMPPIQPQAPDLPGTVVNLPTTSVGGPWNQLLTNPKKYDATIPDGSGGKIELNGKTGDGYSGGYTYTPYAPDGQPQNSTGMGASYKDGKLTVNSTESTTVQQGDSSVKNQSTIGMSSDGKITTGSSTTNTATADGSSSTYSQNFSVSPNGTASANGGYAYGDGQGNTYSASGGLAIGPNGPSATGTLGYEGKDGSASLTGTVTTDQAKLGASVKYGDIKAGASYESIYGRTTDSVVAKDDGGDAYRMLDGGYLGTTRQDQTSLSGSLGVGNVGASAGVFGGSTLTLLTQLPPNFDSLPQPEQDAIKQQRQQQLASVGGFSDIKLGEMANGTGVQFTTYNGWNASAGLSYGGLGVSGGANQSSASQVTIVRDASGMLQVSMLRQDALGTEAGASVLALGLNTKNGQSNTHQFQFQADPNNPEAMKAMDQFIKTGLLPGADALQGKDQQQAATNFHDAVTEVDQINHDIADLKKIPQSKLTEQDRQRLGELQAQLPNAQREIEINRNYLNDQWQQQTAVGSHPVDGVQMTMQTDTRQQSQSMGVSAPVLGNHTVFSSEQTWVHQQALNAQSGVDDLFGYNQKDYVWGRLADEHTATTNSNQNGTVFAMYSDNTIWNNRDEVLSIQNRDLPDYVLDAWGGNIRGRTTVALNQQQLDGMTGSMNDMHNPQSAALWQDFGTRAGQFLGGQEYWLNQGNLMGAQQYSYQGRQSQFRDGLLDPNSPSGQLFAQIPGASDNPDAAMQQMASSFATVKSPEDFKKLSPVEQQLFIQVLGKTSGAEGDLTGTRNSFDTLAVIALVEDPALRAQQMRDLYTEANDQAQMSGQDAVWQFSTFTQRFKDDPALFNLAQQSIHFDWTQEDVDQLATGSTEEQLTQQMHDAYNHTTYWLLQGDVHDPDEQKSLQVLQAANEQGGPAQMDRVLRQSGTNPTEILQSLSGDPVRQHLFYDLLMQTSYAADLTNVPLSFDPNQTTQ